MKKCLMFMKCDKETTGWVLIACAMLGFFKMIHQMKIASNQGDTKDER